ncbi:DUF4402 domain-containing protein [Azoarcus sp. L1K30]|uniref:DUF4402 domain-containing protein n=1 Tax=Azoarcus sp. L1K30 TaxID=2820277 RepID=UPI001B82F6C5|nr:DUF4402 domain-containing protein [Azoarcus sp. L1K30]MBR0565932.1 DUF4402 domain-containing protein [Azoarcus sp. L1K30]
MKCTRGQHAYTVRLLRYSMVLFPALFGAACAWADPALDVIEGLDFGTFALRSNSAVSALRLSASSKVTSSGDIIPVGGAIAGNYHLRGFPASVVLSFELDNTLMSEGGFGLPEHFQISTYEVPSSLVTNAAGEADFSIGARLQSSGSGAPYGDAPYSGSTQLRIRYWSAAVNEYLTFIDQIDLSARVQSTLNLEENQALSFGNIAAFPHASNIARLTLSPNGTVSVSSTGPGARLIALGGAQPGKFTVSGAAANQTIHITPQPGSIFVTHTTLGGSTARFVAKDFVTTPNGSAQTNASGQLSVALGASLETEAGTQGYADGEYRGTYTLEVSY